MAAFWRDYSWSEGHGGGGGARNRERGDSVGWRVAGMVGGLAKVRREKKILIRADSKAAMMRTQLLAGRWVSG